MRQRATRRALFLLSAAALVLVAPGARAQIQSEAVVTSGLSSPTHVVYAPGDFDRLFVTELGGDIEIIDLASDTLSGTFLSIGPMSGEGLQGLAFDPSYGSNGYFYVYFTSSGVSRVRRYTVSANPDLADPASGLEILQLIQPFADHNGGWIGFGPDGYLYLPLGDGGSPHDPNDNGQTIVNSPFGAILRIDVHGDDFPGDPNANYAIPLSNPFVGISGDDEIWAYGLRNPFRSSFDRLTGDLYIADVGQTAIEEINFQPASSTGGENYGWRLREGSIATPTGGVGGALDPNVRTDPLYEYLHGSDPNEGGSVTGGYVYRGPIHELRGKYFFGDYVNDRIWSIEHDGTNVTEFLDWTGTLDPNGPGTIQNIVSFGEDAAGNLYVVGLGGEIYRVIGPTAVPTLPRGGMVAVLIGMVLLSAAAVERRASSGRPSADPG